MRIRSVRAGTPAFRVAGAALVAALAWACGGTVHAQNDQSRREYATPGLVVETGARRGACDVLRFTPDGNHLLAVGDDKVVRSWKFSPAGGLQPAEIPILRWPSWHEGRGNMYALALSTAPESR